MELLRGSADRDALLVAIAGAPGRLAELLHGAADALLDRAPTGEWTARTVAAHLRDDESMVMRPRLERMLVEDRPLLVPFDQEHWAAHRSRSFDDIGRILDGFAVSARPR